MNNKLEINIYNISVEELRTNLHLIIERLDNYIQNQLQEYILGQLNSLDGGPSINDFNISDFTLHESEERGKFRLNFKIDRRYCCSDIESCQQDYLDFDFELKHNQLIAVTEYFDWEINN